METEETKNVSGEVVDNTDYIAAINELKQNSVDRSKYEQLRAENKRLLDSLVNGQTLDQQPTKQPVDIQKLRDNLFNKEHQSNLEYCEDALALRNALIEIGEPDPFLPCGSKTLPTDEDKSTAERVANVIQECIDYSEGDSFIFTNELMRRTVDSTPSRRKK